jgi:quinoprotein glucose dehydrogenase
MQRFHAWVLVASALLAAGGGRAVLQAQGERSTAAGVFTAAQARRGAQVYAENCAMCHGPDLKGSATVPGLAGMEFEVFWRDQPLADLYERISVTMPKTAPGTLKPEQAADAVAYLLSQMKEPAGQAELPASPDVLKTIKIQAARP